jgi:RNA polymerase sigma-70 factor (ECF subfamily)
MSDARDARRAPCGVGARDQPSFVSGVVALQAAAAAERLRQRDPVALAAFFERHRRGLAAYFGRLHWDWVMVPDLVQETLTRAIGAFAGFQGESLEQAAHWLFAIARHVHLQEVSRQVGIRLRRDVAMQMAACAPAGSDGGYLGDVFRALEELPLSQLEVLRLLLEGLGPREIAAALDLPEGTVAIRLHRARRRIHAWLSQEAAPPSTDDDEPTCPGRRGWSRG